MEKYSVVKKLNYVRQMIVITNLINFNDGYHPSSLEGAKMINNLIFYQNN